MLGMGKKSYTIRLYRTHDRDLITFIETHQFNIVKAVYCALTAFSKGESFVISIPPEREDGQITLARIYTRLLTLDTEEDAEAIEIMDKLKDGSKNNFLKNLLRLYLCNPMSEQFLNDTADADFFYQKFAIFRAGKQEVHAGKLVVHKEKPASPGGEQKKKPQTVPPATAQIKPKKQHTVIDEPDYESVSTVESNAVDDPENDAITEMFSSILN